LRDLFQDFSTCFNEADVVAVADVYAAGEAPIEGIDAEGLAASISRHGHRRALTLGGLEGLAAFVLAEAQPGDIVVCMGAGDITVHAGGLAAALG
jgi:UDP-N-acetylmuramate--alanine ligase